LKNVSFDYATLVGCIFADCNLQDAVLCNASLSEANFKNADLRRSDLSGAISTEGVFDMETGKKQYLLPLILHGADMSEAVIKNAVMHGVDFTLSKIDGADFADTDLMGCKFKKTQLSLINLTDAQHSQIVLV